MSAREIQRIDEQTPLVQGSAGRPFSRWMQVAYQVGSVGLNIAFLAISQVWSKELNERPALAFGSSVVVGAFRPFVATFIAPNRIDAALYNYLTKFDVPIFLALSLAQQIAPQTPEMRQIFFPLIFAHQGAIYFHEIFQKIKESKGDHPEFGSLIPMRPLLEGDTRGAFHPFLGKGFLLFTVGMTSFIAGTVWGDQLACRYGLMGAVMGAFLPVSQKIYSELKKRVDHYLTLSATERLELSDVPPGQRLLATVANLSPPLSRLGICGAVATLTMLPGNIFTNLAVGIPAALIDVGRQDAFQYPSREVQRGKGIWNHIKERKGEYAGIAVTGGLVAALWVGNLVYPTPGSVFTASLILGSTAAGFAGTRVLDAALEPGENRGVNQLLFRTTRLTHLLALGFLPLLGNYYVGNISAAETNAMWVLYSLFLGIHLNELLDLSPTEVSTLYLMLAMVTSVGYIQGIL